MFRAETAIDGYKTDHRRQYPDKTEEVLSNWTARSSRIPGVKSVVFIGLQPFLKKYMMDAFDKNFFEKDIDVIAERFTKRMNAYLGPNDIGDQHIRDLHALGYLPLEFCALPEGTLVPLRVPMLTVRNTDPNFAWLVNYIESLMSCELWLPMTTATVAKRLRGLFEEFAEKTGSPFDFVEFQGHDFSFRGMEGYEAAQSSGMGHLTQFCGTDSIPAIEYVEDYYGTDDPNTLIGASVAATEHSVMCAGGEEDELATYKRLLDLYPAGILSVVSDTWDLWKVLTETLPALHEDIMARDGKLVIRPDSGDPADIICGDPTAGRHQPAFKGVVQLLWEQFGGTITETGHKMLDSHIGVIYGDAINYDVAKNILTRLEEAGFASANIVFGCGSFGYQYQTRDTFGFAMKATNVVIDGVDKPIFKKPVTGNGEKNSLRGRIGVLPLGPNGELCSVENLGEKSKAARAAIDRENLLKPVWLNGDFVEGTKQTFEDVRARARV